MPHNLSTKHQPDTAINFKVQSPMMQNDLGINPERRSLQVAPNLLASFNFAWQGFSYAFLTQRNFRIHSVIGGVAIALSLYLDLSCQELAVIILTSGAVLGMELINTALESVVDLSIGQTYSPLAKIAKDCAAAAVLVSALAALGVASTLLLPPFFAQISANGHNLGGSNL